MNVENFKHQYIRELVGLTIARVTTLWKKSKTMSRDEILEAITQSKTAQTRDQQRRLKNTEISDQTPSTQPIQHSPTEPTQAPVPMQATEPKPAPTPAPAPVQNSGRVISALVSARAMPDWSRECVLASIDLNQLKSVVNSLCSRIESQISPTNDPLEMRILRLYQAVEDLLLLRAKRGVVIDVLGILR